MNYRDRDDVSDGKRMLMIAAGVIGARQPLKRLQTAERTLEGIESLNMIRNGQVERLAGRDARGQATFVASLFGVAA